MKKTITVKTWVSGAILVVLLFVLSDLTVLRHKSPERFVAVAEKSLPKTVMIQVLGINEITRLVIDERGFSLEKATATVMVTGAGVFVSPNSHVLTCAHLFWMREVKSITVCAENGDCTAGELLYKKDNRDLALVNSFFTRPTPYTRIADPRELEVGQEVIAIGTPLGLPFSVSHGILSRLNTDDVGYNMTQSDTFINPGNSGGPLFNLDGELVGINSRMVPPINGPVFTGLGFSVAPSEIITFLTTFRGLEKGLPKYSSEYWN